MNYLSFTRFSLARKGYSARQVDDFVDELQSQSIFIYTQLLEQNKQFVALCEEKDQIESMKKQAELLLQNSEKEVELKTRQMLDKARWQANQIRGGLSDQQANELIHLLEAKKSLLHEIEILKQEYESFRAQMAKKLDIEIHEEGFIQRREASVSKTRKN